jgi:hypothetical protein
VLGDAVVERRAVGGGGEKPAHHDAAQARHHVVQLREPDQDVDLDSLPGGVRLATCATRTRLMGCANSTYGLREPPGVSDWLGLHSLPGGVRLVRVVLTPGG